MSEIKICAISDTHMRHDEITIPECDILIHAGDESMYGKEEEIVDFMEWLDKQPAKHLVWTPGNHSVQFAMNYPNSLEWVKKASQRVNVLMNNGVTIEGINIWGSPVTPWFHDWAYNKYRGADIRKVWDTIPANIDIVVTHGPPHGIMDSVSTGYGVGCQDLAEVIEKIKPKYHIFGHIHECYGTKLYDGTTYVNATLVDRWYEPAKEPIVLAYTV